MHSFQKRTCDWPSLFILIEPSFGLIHALVYCSSCSPPVVIISNSESAGGWRQVLVLLLLPSHSFPFLLLLPFSLLLPLLLLHSPSVLFSFCFCFFFFVSLPSPRFASFRVTAQLRGCRTFPFCCGLAEVPLLSIYDTSVFLGGEFFNEAGSMKMSHRIYHLLLILRKTCQL